MSDLLFQTPSTGQVTQQHISRLIYIHLKSQTKSMAAVVVTVAAVATRPWKGFFKNFTEYRFEYVADAILCSFSVYTTVTIRYTSTVGLFREESSAQ